MGNAFCAVADDPSAIYWNPAGLGKPFHYQFLFMRSLLSLDRTFDFIGGTIGIQKFGGVGFGWLHFGVDDIEGRDAHEVATGTFSAGQEAFFLSYGGQSREGFLYGFSLKLLQHKIGEVKATGFGIDIGFIYYPFPFAALGINIQDVATSVKWKTTGTLEKFPINVKIGAAAGWLLLKNRFTTAFDFNYNTAGLITYHVGMEYWAGEIITLQGGLNVDPLSNLLTQNPLRAGFGINYLEFRLNYAFAWDEFGLGYSHRLEVGILY